MNFGDQEGIGLATAHGRDWPSIRQFNIFLANRLGGLMSVVRHFEAADVRVVSLSVVDSSDCAIIRLIPSDPERSYEILKRAGLPFTETDLLVIELPDHRQPLVQICKTLLSAEISVHYAYPLLISGGSSPRAAFAFHVDDHETAARIIASKGLQLLTESDLNPDY